MFEDARRLERRRRILELDRARGRDLFRDTREQCRLHREPGDRRVILHDDRHRDRVGERLVVTHDRVRIQLQHARGADHHRGGAEFLRLPAVGEARPRAFGRRPRDDADAARRLVDDDLDNPRALGLLEPRDLPRHAERGQAIDAGRDEQVDDAPEAGFVELAGVGEGSRQDGIDAFESHRRNDDYISSRGLSSEPGIAARGIGR